MTYPNVRLSRAHKFVTRATGSDMSLTSTAVAELAAATNGPGAGGFDLTLAAQVGDVIECGVNGQLAATAENVAFDIYTVVSGAAVNPFGAGLSASLGSTVGVPAWFAQNVAQRSLMAGSILRTLVAGDLATGYVTIRPYYVKSTATARVLFSSANLGFHFWAKNLGPVDPN